MLEPRGLLFRIAQALVLALPLEDAGEAFQFSFDPARVGAYLDRNGESINRLVTLLEALVVRGSIYGAPMLLTSEPVSFLANQLTEAALSFVIAHEYGHLRNGDLERAETTLAAPGESRIPEKSTSWQDEYEADGAGLLLALLASRIAPQGDLAHAFAGCDFLFSVEDLRFRALSLFGSGSPDVAWPAITHPPPRQRRELLRTLLPRILEGTARLNGHEEGRAERLVQGGLIMAGRTESVLEELWQRAEPRLMALRARGLRPHPVWLIGSGVGGSPPPPRRVDG